MDIRKIDLHMHSTFSDGTDTPEELFGLVRDESIPLFAVTDHDTFEGSASLQRLTGRAEGPSAIVGVEFSCRDGKGEYHILGYGFDPEAAPISRLAETGHMNRLKKLRARLEYLEKEHGISFPRDEQARLSTLDNPGKPHIAGLMVRHGYVSTIREGIVKYLNAFHLPDLYISPQEAIRAVLDSGGIPVLAHSVFGSGNQRIEGADLEERVRYLMDAGLQGLEGFYSAFSPAQREAVLDLARRNRLYVTAGSDYHGANKPIRLGRTGLEEADAIPEGLTRFLEDVRRL